MPHNRAVAVMLSAGERSPHYLRDSSPRDRIGQGSVIAATSSMSSAKSERSDTGSLEASETALCKRRHDTREVVSHHIGWAVAPAGSTIQAAAGAAVSPVGTTRCASAVAP